MTFQNKLARATCALALAMTPAFAFADFSELPAGLEVSGEAIVGGAAPLARPHQHGYSPAPRPKPKPKPKVRPRPKPKQRPSESQNGHNSDQTSREIPGTKPRHVGPPPKPRAPSSQAHHTSRGRGRPSGNRPSAGSRPSTGSRGNGRVTSGRGAGVRGGGSGVDTGGVGGGGGGSPEDINPL